MSMLECDRHKCDNVLCNRYSYKYGYLCNECFEELKNKIDLISIGQFMDSPKGICVYEDTTGIDLEEEFKVR